MVGAITDAVAVEVECRVVAPVIATPVKGPLDVAGTYVFHLSAVVDERVPEDPVVLRTCGKVDARISILETVNVKIIAVGVVYKQTFFRAEYTIVRYFGVVRVVEKHPAVPIAT